MSPQTGALLDMPIAIVGMSCRFPGTATNPSKLWDLLVEGKSAWSEIPANRWNKESFYHPDGARTGTTNVRGGHFLKQDVALFDAPFFNVSAEEAKAMDPQLRLQLETCYEALENAGIPLDKISGTKTSVFSGIFTRDYTESMLRDVETLPRYYVTGTGTAMLANRVSYFFDLKGPSLTVDTGCSTSLVALHLACQSLRAGESECALVGGSNVIINPDLPITLSNMGFLSSEGRSYAFDHRAGGYGRGEGAACLVIKPLDKALRDGDPIHSVIRQTAVNSDGKTDGITQPSAVAHEQLIRYAYDEVKLNPFETQYIEAHGTGTQAGDPLELKAVGSVFGSTRTEQNPVYVGSVKTNVGHLEAASGLAGVIKATLAMQKGIIPPNINFEKANEKIPLDKYNIRIPLRPTPWPVTNGPRRASINSLGYGGTNAHVILEGHETAKFNGSNGIANSLVNGKTNGHANEFLNGTNRPSNEPTNKVTANDHYISSTDKWRIYTFSAKDEDAVRDTIASTRKYLESHEEKSGDDDDDEEFLDNLAFTLCQRRSAFRWINAFPASSVDGLTAALGGRQSAVTRQPKAPRIGFVFTGQGAQWYAMGRELLAAYPVFKYTMQTADTYLKSFGCQWSLIEELSRDQASTLVNSAIVGQPLCTAVQAGLVDLLRSWDIKPTAVTGHSSGEIASAYAAGALTLEAAMQTSYHRGAIAQKTSQLTGIKGGMLAVGLSRESAEEYIKRLTTGKVVAACVNSPSNVTISGDLAAIEELQTILDADGIFARKLKVSTAYHSHHMILAMDGYLDHLKDMPTADSLEESVLCVSSVTGLPVKSAQEFGPEYWVQNAVQPVLFSDALTHLCRGGASVSNEINEESEAFVDVLIEIGPHGALAAPIRQILQAPALKHMSISYLSCLMRNQDARESMQTMATALLLKGAPVNLAEINFPYDVAAGQLQTSRLQVVADLPSYPWSHKTRHWHEPRISKQQRLREHARHDLLGVLSPGQNPAALTWRHFVRLGDQPWVKDHVVDSNILYPAAGFITMVIEAVAQKNGSRFSKTENIGYRLHDMNILSALVVPDTSDGVELQLSLFPCKEELPQADRSYEFRILSCGENDEWNEHCTGRIALEVRSADAGESTWKKSKALNHSPAAISFAISDKACTQEINTGVYYEGVKKLGINYGETFQNLTEIRKGPSQSLTTVQVRDTAALMPSKLEQPHIIHPTTLDAIFQSIYPALDNNGTIMVPTYVKSLYVSQSGIVSTPGLKLKISTNAEKNRNGATASLVVVHEMETSVPVVEIDELKLSSIGSSLDEINDESWNEANVCFKVSQNLDISFMNRNEFVAISKTPANPTELKISSDLQQACFYMIERALKKLTAVDHANLTGHHLAMHDWMVYQQGLAPQTWFDASDTDQDKLIAAVENESVNGEMCLRVGRYLVQILRSEIEPLQIMMQDGLLYKYYEHALGMKRVYSHLSQILRLYSHKNPGAKVLEIGGGTGGCTVPALQALTTFGHYDFTDISSGFFEKAKEKLSQWGDRISYKKFDAEVDASTQQDIHCGEYDLVIACNVLHATTRMDKTMANVRKLIRPGGKLLVIEGTRDTLDISLVFGVLPGWWLSQEEERRFSPKLPLAAWDRLLQATGFTGQEAVLLDAPKEEDHVYSVFLSSVIADAEAQKKEYHPETTILLGQQQKDLPEDFLELLNLSLEQISGHVATVSRFDNASLNGKVLVVLAELDNPILSSLTEEEFLRLREILKAAKGVLWVTTGGTMECSSPEAAMVTGLMRTLRTENTAIRYATLDLDPARKLQPFTAQASSTISKIFEATLDFGSPNNIDLEYSEREGQIFIPRVTQDIDSDKTLLQTGDRPPVIEDQPFYREEDRPLKLEVGTAGLLDTMRFIDDTATREELLLDDYVEVAPKAFGLNFRDVMIAMGQLTETIMGYECAGVITRVGKNVTHLKPGDRVAAMMRGNYAHYIHLLGIAVSKIPDESISFEQATSMPMIFSTAYFSLYDTARLQKGETVLIHAAAGGVGQAAIMLAKLVGAEIYATVGSMEKCRLLMDTYGIPEDHIFSSRNDSFVADIMAATDGKGVDVALNSLSGHLLHATWKCMAMFGRLIEIGKRDIEINTRLDMNGFQGNVSFSAIDLTYMGRFKPRHLSDILEKCMVLAAEGKIHAVKPITVFPISDIERAFRYMQAGKHTGKVVIKPNDGDIVKVLAHPRKSSLFRANSTYILVGGLGGLGQSLSRWMVKNGARNLVILSRSGMKHTLAEKLATDLAQAGCENVWMPECDITNSNVVEGVVKDAAKSLPPIRGVIQGAMVLNDCIFEHMSFSQYQNAVLPKVQGTWNLHNTLLHTNLDFFIMLSSAVGIVGNASQANYGAGSSFLDALAQHRRTLGLPAASLDLGIISSVGYVAENEDVAKRLARMGHDSISEQKMLGLIEVAVQQQSSSQGPSQIVTGLSLRELEAAWIQDAKFSILRQSSSSSSSTSKDESQKDKQTLHDKLQSIKSQADAVSVICDSIITKLANNLMVSDADIDPDQPISVCGVDSLVAVELRNWLLGQTGAEISVVDILQCKSLVGLSESVAKTSKVVKKILVGGA